MLEIMLEWYSNKSFSTTNSKPVSSLELAADVLALKSVGASNEKRRIIQATLQSDLAIECVGDLRAILAFTEKIRPRTYIDVLGDPQLDNIDVIKEFASL